jgi:hypothetical protein
MTPDTDIEAHRRLRESRAATGRVLAGIFSRAPAYRTSDDDHVALAGGQIAIILADGGSPEQAITEARTDAQPALRAMADHLAGVFGRRAAA